MSEKMLDLIWSLDIEKMNDHLPTEHKSLKDLLADDQPIVMTKKNQKHRIKKKDLEIVASYLPESEWENIKLPIVLLRRTNLAKGIYSVSGGIRELFIIFRITKKTEGDFSKFKLDEHQPYIWKPEAFTAIRKIGSIVIMGYA